MKQYFVQNSIKNAKPDDRLAKDIESAMSENVGFDQGAFNDIFKDRKPRGQDQKQESLSLTTSILLKDHLNTMIAKADDKSKKVWHGRSHGDV